MIKPEEVLPGWVVGWPKGTDPMYAHGEAIALQGSSVTVFYQLYLNCWRVGARCGVLTVPRNGGDLFLPDPCSRWKVHPTQWGDPLAAQAWVMLHGPEKLVLELTSK